MRVRDLIKVLKRMPQDAFVWHLWDGEARTQIQHVWLSRNGEVITADEDEHCYSDGTRPVGAPTEKEQTVWYTPKLAGRGGDAT